MSARLTPISSLLMRWATLSIRPMLVWAIIWGSLSSSICICSSLWSWIPAPLSKSSSSCMRWSDPTMPATSRSVMPSSTLASFVPGLLGSRSARTPPLPPQSRSSASRMMRVLPRDAGPTSPVSPAHCSCVTGELGLTTRLRQPGFIHAGATTRSLSDEGGGSSAASEVSWSRWGVSVQSISRCAACGSMSNTSSTLSASGAMSARI
mmetsp:Transcript_39529/g.105060  ORF Transcript_39529/g.105060 Transcript_39529/m.105060 type:complete len:207 (-) Transcript_39529:837-1457(-)